MSGGGGDSDEETVFSGAGGASGDGDGSGLRGAGGACGDGDNYVFIDDSWAGAGTALTDAIEIGVVVLAREVDAGFAVADGEIFAAKECC